MRYKILWNTTFFENFLKFKGPQFWNAVLPLKTVYGIHQIFIKCKFKKKTCLKKNVFKFEGPQEMKSCRPKRSVVSCSMSKYVKFNHENTILGSWKIIKFLWFFKKLYFENLKNSLSLSKLILKTNFGQLIMNNICDICDLWLLKKHFGILWGLTGKPRDLD